MPDRVLARELHIDLCREADVLPLMRFIGTQWQAGHILSRDEALFRWQFAPELLKNQHPPGPTVLLARFGCEIVGMLGLTGFDLNVSGARVPAMWLSHWFAAPAYRVYNVALRLMRAARDLGVEAHATLGANEVSARLLARLGFEAIPSLPRWVGVFDVEAAAELVCVTNPEVLPAEALRLCRGHVAALPATAGSERRFRPTSWSSTTAAAWDRFWSERLAPQQVGASRDAAYLQWRYVAHPRFDYHVAFARQDADGAVEGVAVFRIEQVQDRATRVVRIVEFLASAAAEDGLVRWVLEAGRDAGAAMADFYCSSPRAAQAWIRAGFRRQGAESPGAAFPSRLQPLESGHFPMTTLVRLPEAWRGTLPQLVDDGRLYITKSDGDQDRPN